jgi:hypothetical protein
MKQTLSHVTILWLALATPACAGIFPCCNFGVHCVPPPPPACPDCSCPCDKRLHFGSSKRSAHAQELIEHLAQGDCCERIKAAQKLGCRLHADFCCDPEVLTALVRALQCDPCWEVRRAAAWSIMLQNARVEEGVLALYLASKLDPHFLVRVKAADALDVLLVCRRGCFKELFETADELVKQLKGHYKPGGPECGAVFEHCCQACIHHGTPPTPNP